MLTVYNQSRNKRVVVDFVFFIFFLEKTLQRLCRYIDGNDPMIGYLTVKQHLTFQVRKLSA